MAMKQRATHLVGRALQHPEGNDAPVTLELCDLIRRGGAEDVMEALKDPLKHQPPQIQLRALGCVNACVNGSGPEFAVYLSGEEWMERFFRIAKSTESQVVRDNVILLIIQWSRRHSTAGFRRALTRYANSKTLGEPYGQLSARVDQEARMQDRLRGSQLPQQPYASQPASAVNRQSVPQGPPAYSGQQNLGSRQQSGYDQPEPSAPRAHQISLSRLETFLMEAQTDLANLEFALEHPGFGDMAQAVADCDRHLQRCNNALNQSGQLPEDATVALLQLSEQLANALEIGKVLAAIPGDEPAQPQQQQRNVAPAPRAAAVAPPVASAVTSRSSAHVDPAPRQGGIRIGDSDDDAAGNDSDNDGDLQRVQSSVHAQRELAQMQVEAQTVKMLEDERKETARLRAELEAKMTELDEAQRKYKDAKKKNQEAVVVAEDLANKLDAAESEVASLRSAMAKAEAAPPPPPPEPKIVTVYKKAEVDPRIVRKLETTLSSIKRSFRGLKDDVNDLHKELDVFATRASSAVNHIMTAAEAERAGDVKALQWVQELYKKEQKLRKQYYNTIQELKGNIRVYCRIRPMSESELKNGHEQVVTFPAEDEIQVMDDKGKAKRFEFDVVFPPTTTQEAVFADTAPLIDSVVDGYNVCIFAYGQTGSGKTHTMNGYGTAKGINRRALDRLFTIIGERKETETSTVWVSVLEVYCEQIRDLLASKAENNANSYEIRTNGEYGNYVTNLKEIQVHSAEQIEAVLATASGNRSEGRTDMNAHSSRSHMLLYILVKTVNNTTNVKSYGKLSLVDLAGSERLDKSGSEGQAAKEAAAINKSLSALGDVIAGLSSSAKHIPFRNSVLTFLLQDSMQGQAKVLMFCCASPASYNSSETLSSLSFAVRARGVALGPVKKNATTK